MAVQKRFPIDYVPLNRAVSSIDRLLIAKGDTGEQFYISVINLLAAVTGDVRGISSIERTSGDGAAGTTDTYTITYTDDSTFEYTIVNGANGITPHIGANGNWYIDTTDTGLKSVGDNGVTPHIGANGNWYIDTTDTGLKSVGDNGLTPHIGGNGNWFIDTTDTGVKSVGANGVTPHIGGNGNWFIDATDTGVKALAIDGRGITSIELTDTIGLVDEYTITYTDETTQLFLITNGENGQNGTSVPVNIPIFKRGANGIADPQIWVWINDVTVTSVHLLSNCSGISVTINGITYNHITLVGVTIPAGTEMIINDITIIAGKTNANALIIC